MRRILSSRWCCPVACCHHCLAPARPTSPPAKLPPLAEDKRACNWCFQQANCALAHKAERGAAAATLDSFVRQSTDRGGGALDRVQQELAGKYERAAGHMTQAGVCWLGSSGAG